MYCPDCGHQNPAGNKFCGMCGERLPERASRDARPVSAPAPIKASDVLKESRTDAKTDEVRATTGDRRERIAERDPEPVAASLRHREPIDEPVREVKPIRPAEPIREVRPVTPVIVPVNRSSNAVVEEPIRKTEPARPPEPDYIPESEMPPAVASFYSSRLESATPLEQPTTLSGPSFLGLSNAPSSSDSSYSYLYEDEQPKSHAGIIVFLLVLAILAAVVYWKWQPIHDYVVNAAVAHSNAAHPTAAQPATGDTSTSSQAAQPPASDQANNPGAAQKSNDSSPNGQKPDQPKTDNAQPKSQASPDKSDADKTDTPKDERPQAEVGRKSRFQNVKGKNDEEASDEDAESAKPSSARRSAPAQPAGAQLVATGEKYLYGKGVPRSCGQAVNAFNEAAKQQNPSAMSHLGALYATGECVPFNRVRAYDWFSRALAQDRSNTYIEHNLNMLWREMSAQEQAQVTGKKMF